MEILLLGRLDSVLDAAATRIRTEVGDTVAEVAIHTATTIAEVKSVLADHPVDHVVSGAGLPLRTRLDVVSAVFDASDSTSVHLKDVASGPEGLTGFALTLLGHRPAAVDVHLVVSDPARAAQWYAEVLGGRVQRQITLPTGRVVIAEALVGATTIALAPPFGDPRVAPVPEPSLACYHVAVGDADAVMEAALAAGASERTPVQDAPWGQRTGQFIDPFGHRWAVDQHLEEVTDDDLGALLAGLFVEPGPAVVVRDAEQAG